MAADRLYNIALKYKKTKLWKQLYDTELFAVKLSDGKIGYCSVMGELGEHIAIALYIGCDGLDSYRSFCEIENAHNEAEYQESFLLQDCVQCSFENKDELSSVEIDEAQRYAKAHGITYRGRKSFPQFVCYRPYRYPWSLQKADDEQHLFEALSAAIEVVEKLKMSSKSSLGFMDGAPYDRVIPLLESDGNCYIWSTMELPDRQEKIYPSPKLHDDLLIDRVKRSKRNNKAWACEVIVLPTPYRNESEDNTNERSGKLSEMEEAPIFPFTLLTIDYDSQMILPNDLVSDYAQDAEKFLFSLAHSMHDNGVPAEILVRDERTETLLSEFSKQIGVSIWMCDELSVLDEVEEELLAHFRGEDLNGDVDELFSALMKMDQETMRSMPSEVLEQLLELDRQGVLPEEIAVRIRQLLK